MRQCADAHHGRRIGEVMMSREQPAGHLGRAGAATRGHLRIYLGSAPDAGTTFAMLSEAHRRAERGTDVVVAYVNTHGRPCTAALVEGLEVIPRARVPFRGAMAEELDLDAVLARRPEVALLDEFAHANVPGSRHATRWQDAGELLRAGIDVVSTVDVRHLDSLRDVVEKITGGPPCQTVPDAFVRAADEVQIVDTAPETLRARMAHGDIYPAVQAQAALADWFRIGNLSALRELALLWLAAMLAENRHRDRPSGPLPGGPPARERVVVALPGGPDDQTLIRRAARIAARTAGDLLAVHVARPAGPADTGRAALTAQRRLVSSVGGTYHQLSDDDIPAALLTFAQAENATQLVLGATRRSWRSALLPRTAVRSQVLRAATGIDVHIVTCTQILRDISPTAPARESRQDSAEDGAAPVLPRRRPAASERADPQARSSTITGLLSFTSRHRAADAADAAVEA
jgi:two-component system sensor histidine kinase KdpD